MSKRENKLSTGHMQFFSMLVWHLLLIVLTGFVSLRTSAQCIATIENNASEICLGNAPTKTFSAALASGGTIDWISSGDGTFNDNTLVNPTYTPGPRDLANGYAFIYLDVYKDDSLNPCSALPLVALYFSSMNASAAPSTQSVCSGVGVLPIYFTGAPSNVTYNWTRNNTATITGLSSGTGTVRGGLGNINASPVTVTYTVTPTAATCTGTPFTATVIVNPKPVATAVPSTQTICSGSAITAVTLNSVQPGTTYTWTRNNTSSVTGPASGTGNITGAFTNTTTAAVTVTFTITPTSNGCSGNAISSTVIVNPAQNITATPSTQTICSGGSVSPVIFNGSNGTNYSWTRDNTASVAGIAANGSGNITGSLTNNSSLPLTVTFTTTSSGGCPGIATVMVNPVPNAVATPAAQTICSESSITPILLTGNVSGTTFNWSRDNPVSVTGVDAGGSGDITCILLNTTVSSAVITFTVTPIAAGCPGIPVTAAVTVNPHPKSVISGNQTLCTGQSLSAISIALSGTSPWSFTYTDGATPVTVTNTSTNPYSFIPQALPATYTVTVLSDAGCTALASDITGSAVLSSASFALTAAGSANGNISPAGSTTVNCGNNQTYSIAANTGYNIQDVMIDGVSQGPVSSYTFSNVTAPHTISASFIVSSGNGFNITASSGVEGTITPAGITNVSGGSNQTYTITANSCYEIADVTVDGTSVGAVSTYTFQKVAGPHTISASYKLLTFGITASADVNGGISPNGITTVSCGSNQTYSITPNSCYQIANVFVDGVSVGSVSSYTFANVTAAHNISVTFSQLSYVITASAGVNGVITPGGTASVNCGSNQTYNITANAGFIVQSVLVDGVSQGNINTFTFNNITATHTLSATFIMAGNNCIAPAISGIVANVLCRNGSTGAVNVTTSGGTAPFTYAWTGPNGFTASTEDIANVPAGTYRITVAATGGCSATANYTVSQPAGSLFAAASFSPILCNGGTTNVVMTASGGTIPYTGAGTISGQVAGSRSYTVTDANGCKASSTVNILQPSALTATATAGAVQCGTGTATLTVSTTGGTGTKQYKLNGGAFQSGNTFTVTPAGSPYTVTVKDANSCIVNSASVTVSQPSASSAPAAPASVSGPVYGLCGGGSFTYIVSAVTGATGYTWTAPVGCSITAGQGTNQIQLSVPASFTGPGTLGVSAVNSCGTGVQYKMSVFGILYYSGSTITGPSVVVRNQAGVQYSLPYTAGTTFTWLVPTGSVITSGQGTNAITVTFGTTNGNISVDVQNACGTAPRTNKAVTLSLSRPASKIAPSLTKTYFSVYPNPAQNTATAAFNTLKAGSRYDVVISNTMGNTIYTKQGTAVAGINVLQLDLSHFNNGMYVVRLTTEENTQTEKLFKQ